MNSATPTLSPSELILFANVAVAVVVPAILGYRHWEQDGKLKGWFWYCAWGAAWRTWLYGIVAISVLWLLYWLYPSTLDHLLLSFDRWPAPFGILLRRVLLLGATFLLWGMMARVAVAILRRRMEPAGAVSTHRGSKVVDGTSAQRQFQKDLKKLARDTVVNNVVLAGLWCPLDSETRHFKIMGVTGTGKSAAIRGMLQGVQARSAGLDPKQADRVVIADPDGGYLSRFYNRQRGDTILNPFDARSSDWALFKELRNPYDADQIAASLVPDLGGDNSVWAGYARTLVSSTIEALKESGAATTRDLYDAINSMENEELGVLLAHTSACRFFGKGAEETLGSIRTNAAQALRGLSYLSRNDSFSITDWVQRGRGWLFLPYRADQIAALRPLITTWMRTAIFATLSLSSEKDAKLWFVIDELDALGKIDGLTDAMQRMRKFGGRVVLGFQSIGPVETIYGKGYSEALAENANNSLILRCSAGGKNGGTSGFASHLIGQRQVNRRMRSNSRSTGTSSTSTSRGANEQIQVEDAVMPAEIEQLPDRTGYVKFATEQSWMRVGFPYDGLPVNVESFIAK